MTNDDLNHGRKIESFLDERKKRKSARAGSVTAKAQAVRDILFVIGSKAEDGFRLAASMMAKNVTNLDKKTKPYCRDPDDRAKINGHQRKRQASKKEKKRRSQSKSTWQSEKR